MYTIKTDLNSNKGIHCYNASTRISRDALLDIFEQNKINYKIYWNCYYIVPENKEYQYWLQEDQIFLSEAI